MCIVLPRAVVQDQRERKASESSRRSGRTPDCRLGERGYDIRGADITVLAAR